VGRTTEHVAVMQLVQLSATWPAFREIKCSRQGQDLLEWLCERKVPLTALLEKVQNKHR